MQPTLLSIGSLNISSFGVFIILAILGGVFVVWRLAKVYEVDEEKILDLAVLSFIGGLLGARVFFVVFNWEYFQSLEKVLIINRYPGLSFWGALVGGFLTLRLITLKSRLNFWQIADFGAVALILGIILGNIGCFLGGCAYGTVSDLPIATAMVGVLGKRMPIQIIESLILLPIFFRQFRATIRFHFAGKIVSSTLLWLGAVKLLTEPFRGDPLVFGEGFRVGLGMSLVLIVGGVFIFYLQSKRNLKSDFEDLTKIITSGKRRQELLQKINKSCYNLAINWKFRLKGALTQLRGAPFSFRQKGFRLIKLVKKKINVKSTPTDIR